MIADCLDKMARLMTRNSKEYLLQENNEDEEKRKLLLVLANMVGES
jgi:hypothetical protein